MSDFIGIRSHVVVTGGPLLMSRLTKLPTRVQKRVTRRAVKIAGRKLVKDVKATISTGHNRAIDSGLLKKSIGFRAWTSKKNKGTVGVTVGARKGFGTMVVRNKKGDKKGLTKKGIEKHVAAGGGFRRAQYADPVKYAHMPEGGTQRRRGRGRVQGVHFMEHTFVRQRQIMMSTLRKEISVGIAQETRKLARKKILGT